MERKLKSIGNLSRSVICSTVSLCCHLLLQFHSLYCLLLWCAFTLITDLSEGREKRNCTSLGYSQSLPSLYIIGLSPKCHRYSFIHTGIYVAVPLTSHSETQTQVMAEEVPGNKQIQVRAGSFPRSPRICMKPKWISSMELGGTGGWDLFNQLGVYQNIRVFLFRGFQSKNKILNFLPVSSILDDVLLYM